MNIQDLFKKYNELVEKCDSLQKQVKHLRKNNKEINKTMSNLCKDMKIIKNNKILKTDFDNEIVPCPKSHKPIKTRGMFIITDWCVLADCNQPECHNCFPVKSCEKHDYCIDHGKYKYIPIYSESESD